MIRRNPVAQIDRPTIMTLAPIELSPDARSVLNTLLERQDSKRLVAIVALAYWAALRISEIATLRLDHCRINQRSGTITIVDAKSGKTRTLDLPNQARRTRERHAVRLGEQVREARSIVMRTLHDWGVWSDLNLLLTAGLCKDLAQLVWEMQDSAGTAGDRQLVVVE